MLFDQLNKVDKILMPLEDLSFPVLNVFLQVKSSGFRDAKIFHGIRNFYTHFFGYPEEMIHGISARENNSCVVLNIDFVFPELTSSNPCYRNELFEVDIDFVFINQISIRRLLKICGLWLRNKNIFYFQLQSPL